MKAKDSHLKRLLLLFIFFVLSFPMVSRGQADTLTVADDSVEVLPYPINLGMIEFIHHTQMLYSANMTSSIVGDSITGLGFYIYTPSALPANVGIVVKLGIRASSTLTTIDNTTPLKQVWTGTVDGIEDLWMHFDTAFAFLGGNLLVDVTTVDTSTLAAMPGSFLGIYKPNVSRFCYNWMGYAPQTLCDNYPYLPKMSLLHVDGEFDYCPMPTEVSVAEAEETGVFLVSWNSAGEDLAEYEVLVNGLVVDTTTLTYLLLELDPHTLYTVGVRTLCGETGMVSGTCETEYFTPCAAIDTLPWREDFEIYPSVNSENYMSASCWSLLTDATGVSALSLKASTASNHTAGGTRSLMWSYSNNSVSGTYHLLMLPEINTDSIAINNLQLKLWARSANFSDSCRFAYGVVSDTNDATSFFPVGTFTIAGSSSVIWHQITLPFSGYQGSGRRMALREVGTPFGKVYLDDFSITPIPSCSPVTDISVKAVTAGSVFAEWDTLPGILPADGYMVRCNALDGSEEEIEKWSDDRYVALSGLSAGKHYRLEVVPVCEDVEEAGDSIVFNTRALDCPQLVDDALYVAIGNGDSSCSVLPITGELFSKTQQTFNKMEVGGSGEISQLLFHCKRAPFTEPRHLTIYMGHSMATGYVEQQSDARRVYDGICQFVGEEWYTFVLDSVFNYDTSLGNLIVKIIDSTGAVSSGSTTFYSHSILAYYISSYSDYENGYLFGNPADFRDDIVLKGECEEWSPCAAPAIIPMKVVEDEVVLYWLAGFEETAWNVDYRLVGDTGWTNLLVGTTAQETSIYGLSAGAYYEFRVSYLCDGQLKANTLRLRTPCGLLTGLPLYEEFNGDEIDPLATLKLPNCWNQLTSSGTTLPKVGQGSLHIDAPPSGGYSAVILPGLDPNTFSISNLMLSFRYRKSSNSGFSARFVIGGMSNPGDISTFVPYDTLFITGSNPNWEKHTVYFTDFPAADTCHYVVILRDGLNYAGGMLIDDVILTEIPPCEGVENIEVVTAPASALVTWQADTNSTGVMVKYCVGQTDSWDSVEVVDQNYLFLSGLVPETMYDLQVSTYCVDGSLVLSPVIHFKTKAYGCAVFSDSLILSDTIGNDTLESQNLPCRTTASASQQIYTSEELGMKGLITSIAIMPKSVVTDTGNVEIYLAHVDESELSTFLYPSDLVKVFAGNPGPMVSDEWKEFELMEPYYYNGSENLLVFFRSVIMGNYPSNKYYVHVNPNGNCIHKFPGNGAVPVFYYSQGDLGITRNNMKFSIIPCDSLSTCAEPLCAVKNEGTTTVDVEWIEGDADNSYNCYFRPVGEECWTLADAGVEDNEYQFAGLMPGYRYEFRIESNCAQQQSSFTAATTKCSPISQLPFFESFNYKDDAQSELPNCWSAIESSHYESYCNHSGLSGYSILLFYVSNASNHHTYHLTLPPLDTAVYHVNETQLSFYAYRPDNSYVSTPAYIVGVLGDNHDSATFTPVDTVYHSVGLNQWEQFVVPLSSYTDSGVYISIHPYNSAGLGYNGFIDDVKLELASPCPLVNNLVSSGSTDTSVNLSWADYAGASAWQISYGPFGTQPGEGILVTATGTLFTLSNPGYCSGVFYVRPLCTNGDTGFWNINPGVFYLNQMPATIPYNYDFESPTEWNNWQGQYNDLTHVWSRGTLVADSGSYSTYVSSKQGSVYKPYLFNEVTHAALFRDIDFGPFDTTFLLTFRVRAGGTDNPEKDSLAVFFTDTTQGSGAPFSVPSAPLVTVRSDTNWNTYTVSLDHYSGVKRLVFLWHNSYSPSAWALHESAALDNIHINYISCPRPTDIEAVLLSSLTVTLTWNGLVNATYEVLFNRVGDTVNSFIINTNQITFNDLETFAFYNFKVRRICGPGDTSFWSDGFEFFTPPCQDGNVAYNFSTLNSYSTALIGEAPLGPVNKKYSYSQTLIDSAYMASLGDPTITAFGFNTAAFGSLSSIYTKMNVFLANVPEKNLSGGWILPDSSIHIFHKVLDSANLDFSTIGWQIHTLDSAFTWDGHSNVLLSVQRNHGKRDTVSPQFFAHENATVKTCFAWRSASPVNYQKPKEEAILSTLSPDILFLGCSDLLLCEPPAYLEIPYYDNHCAFFQWSGNADQYQLRYRKASDPDWGPLLLSDTTCFQFFNLVDSTDYLFQVRSVCLAPDNADTLYSNWAEKSFHTHIIPCMTPVNLRVTDVSYNSITIEWDPTGSESQWIVVIWDDQHTDTLVADSHPFTITDLVPNAYYHLFVAAQCAPSIRSGDSDPILFQMSVCPYVQDLTVSKRKPTSAKLTWKGEGIGYDIEYGPLHFDHGINTEVVHVTETTYTITGLQPGQDYSASVRTQCYEALFSPYCAQVDFTTPITEDIEPAQSSTRNPHLSIIPNPTSDATTVTISGVTGEVELLIVDLNGRVVMREEITCTGDCEKLLQVAGLPAGAYFVRLGGDNLNIVKKLIVK